MPTVLAGYGGEHERPSDWISARTIEREGTLTKGSSARSFLGSSLPLRRLRKRADERVTTKSPDVLKASRFHYVWTSSAVSKTLRALRYKALRQAVDRSALAFVDGMPVDPEGYTW